MLEEIKYLNDKIKVTITTERIILIILVLTILLAAYIFQVYINYDNSKSKEHQPEYTPKK